MKYSLLAISSIIFILSPILSIQETGAPSMPYVLCMIIPSLLYFIVKKYSYNVKAFLLGSAFFISGVVSTIISPIGVMGVGVIKQLLFILYFIVIASITYSDQDIRLLFKCIVYLSIILCILILLSYAFGYVHTSSDYYVGRYSIGITGLYKNPNYLTGYMNIGLFIILYYRYLGYKKLFSSWFTYLACFLFLFALYLSGTRASLLNFVIYFAILIGFSFRKKPFQVFLILLIALILLGYYSNSLMNSLDMFLGNRTLTEDEGRSISWALAINNIKNNPLFGCGFFAWSHIGTMSTLEYLHNVFLELILNQGLVGLVLFLLLFFYDIKRIKKTDSFFVYTLIFVSGFQLFFQNGVIDVNFWRFVILNRIIINFSKNNQISVSELYN